MQVANFLTRSEILAPERQRRDLAIIEYSDVISCLSQILRQKKSREAAQMQGNLRENVQRAEKVESDALK